MTGTVMERSHAKLTQWAAAFHMAASSKKGFSAHQLHRELGCQYNTAWFLHHRVMEAMRRGGLDLPPIGGEGKIVEADETYFGNIPEAKPPHSRRLAVRIQKSDSGPKHKRAIIALSSAAAMSAHSMFQSRMLANVVEIVGRISPRNAPAYRRKQTLPRRRARNLRRTKPSIMPTKEYARGDVTTNTVEGYFSIFKRGMRGVYQHCAEKHLHRYLAEFDFRYNYRASLGYNDTDRTIAAVRGGEGKRLTYHQPR